METILMEKEILASPEVWALLRYSVYDPTLEKLTARARQYREDDTVSALCLMEDELPLGLLVCRISPERAVFLDFAVEEARRKQGIGRKLLREASLRFQKELFAETDDDAVEFYRRCGFAVRSLGKNTPGTVRYECRRPAFDEKGVEFSPMKETDFPFLSRLLSDESIITALHNRPMTVEQVLETYEQYWKNDPDELHFILSMGGVPMGWLKLNGLCDEETGWISMLAVSPAFQGTGAGKAAVTFAESFFRERGKKFCGIHTTADNTRAAAIYGRCGYTLVETGPCITGDGASRMGFTFLKILDSDSPSGEILDLYDENRKPLGKFHRRGDPLPEGAFRLGAEIWVISGDKLLLTQRAPQKSHPYQWEGTGGSALAGEDSLACIKRELLEETGLDISGETPLLLLQYKRPDGFTDVYAVRKKVELSKLSLQKSEVMAAKLVSLNQFDRMCQNGQVICHVEKRFRLIEEQIECLMEPEPLQK